MVEETLKKIKQCVSARLADCPTFPVPVDKMTEREYKIAEVAFHAVGALRFIQSLLEEMEERKKWRKQ